MVAQSGLDLDLGNRCSSIACRWSRTTAGARAGREGALWEGLQGSFSSVLEIAGRRVALTSDGIGTKIEVAERLGRYDTLGWDLTAMVADDLAANGAEPTNLTNVLDVDRLDEGIVDELLRGLASAANASAITLAGGEIAELGGRVAGWGPRMHFNWCATALGVFAGEPIDGSRVVAGDAVVALRERGFRSNGFSRLRSILADAFGEDWQKARFDSRTWGEVLLTPSRVFASLVTRMLASGVDPHGIAHITGGGIPDKLGRVLRPTGLGAYLSKLFPPSDFMLAAQAMGRVPDDVAYRSWNMGNGMLVVVAPSDVERTLAIASSLGFEAGEAGQIVSEPIIRIASASGRAVAFPRG